MNWNQEDDFKTIRIGLLSRDTSLYRELNEIFKNEPVKGKKARIQLFYELEEITKTHVLYIDKDYNYMLNEIYRRNVGQNVLIITERAKDLNSSMINLVYNRKTDSYSFKVNNNNIENEGMKATPELLLIGGSENDLRELYKETRQELDKQLKKLESQKLLLEVQNREISSLNKEIEEKKVLLGVQKQELDKQENEFSKQNKMLDELQWDIESKKTLLQQNSEKIEEQNNIVLQLHGQILAQKTELSEVSIKLEEITEEYIAKQKRIEDQNIILLSQEIKIAFQRNMLLILVISLTFIITLAIFIYRAYIIKKRSNKKLDEKNIQLSYQQEEILIKSAELEKVNKTLKDEKKKVEDAFEEIKRTQAQLVQSEKMASLGVLTAGIAHEINNPINFVNSGIGGLRSLLGEVSRIFREYDHLQDLQEQEKLNKIEELSKTTNLKEITTGFNELTKNIEAGIKRTSEIIRGLNTFSRADNDDVRETSINDNLDITLLMLRSQYKNKVEIEKDYGDIPPVECYPGRINQVFMNVVANAIQSIDDTGKVIISTRKLNGHVSVTISDTGSGIDPDKIDEIFTPFYTTKQVGKGTGLGLSISYAIIEQHSGKISVNSQKGKGTSFTIDLPINFQNQKNEHKR